MTLLRKRKTGYAVGISAFLLFCCLVLPFVAIRICESRTGPYTYIVYRRLKDFRFVITFPNAVYHYEGGSQKISYLNPAAILHQNKIFLLMNNEVGSVAMNGAKMHDAHLIINGSRIVFTGLQDERLTVTLE